MCEFGPFIEYCGRAYIDMTVINAFVAGAATFTVICLLCDVWFTVQHYLEWRRWRKSEK